MKPKPTWLKMWPSWRPELQPWPRSGLTEWAASPIMRNLGPMRLLTLPEAPMSCLGESCMPVSCRKLANACHMVLEGSSADNGQKHAQGSAPVHRGCQRARSAVGMLCTCHVEPGVFGWQRSLCLHIPVSVIAHVALTSTTLWNDAMQ